MDSLTISGLALLGACLIALLAASALGIRYELAPAIATRLSMRSLRAEVQRLADEHAAQPAPRSRHAAHCPACGRFARITSSGPRGIRTRCAVHGIRLRAVKRIGEREHHLIALDTHRPLVALPGHAAPPPLHLEPPMRMADWLDGEAERDDLLRDMMRAAA